MATTETPASLSIFRGQADQGIGEPGARISRGEQFIAAAPALHADATLLRALRPWLTLESTPADHGRAGGHLAGWACFTQQGWYFVVRLGNAGQYGGRDAYFAHARAWPVNVLSSQFDPGLYLGQHAAFLTQGAAIPPDGTEPALPPLPEPDAALLTPHHELLVSLIAHLFQGMQLGRPVVMAVPVATFAADHPLPQLVGIARAALPARLRRRARIRLFSRGPRAFFEPGGAGSGGGIDLLVVPEDASTDALTAARRQAILLDPKGGRLDGPAPAPALFDYARAVLERLGGGGRFPAQLTAFSERFDACWAGDAPLPTETDIACVGLIYNLAVALGGAEALGGGLFANVLLAQARANPDLPWARLLSPADLRRFQPEPLARFILRADEDLDPGEERLQQALVKALPDAGIRLDDAVTAWWKPADPVRRRRLLELCLTDPPVVSAALAAGLTGALSLADLSASGGPLVGALRLEYRQGQLGRRQGEAAVLLTHLDEPGLFALLREAGASGALRPPWETGELHALPVAQALPLLRLLLLNPMEVQAQPDLAGRLLARLRREPAALAGLADALAGAVRNLDPATAPSDYLDIATALTEARPAGAEEVQARFWERTDGLARVADPTGLLARILAADWPVLTGDHLLGADGSLNVKPTPRVAAALLLHGPTLDRLKRRDLMQLGAVLPADAADALAAWHRRVARLMTDAPEPTTRRLIQHGAWLAWRRHADPDLSADDRRRYARLWLSCPLLDPWRRPEALDDPPAWLPPAGAVKRRELPDPTLETWRQVLADLAPIQWDDMGLLIADETHWPWLYPFGSTQVRGLFRYAASLDAAALLCTALTRQAPVFSPAKVQAFWTDWPGFAEMPATAVPWLLNEHNAPPLELDIAQRLWASTEHFHPRGTLALIAAVTDGLAAVPDAALNAADAARLWENPALLLRLRTRLAVLTLSDAQMDRLEAGLRQAPPATNTDAPPVAASARAEAWHAKGWTACAELLAPGIGARLAEANWPARVIAALADPDADASAFADLRARLRAAAATDVNHPLMVLLQAIWNLPTGRRMALTSDGWKRLQHALANEPAFYHWVEHENRLLLPALHLAIVLRRDGHSAGGVMTRDFMYRKGLGKLRRDPRWWLALLGSLLEHVRPARQDSRDERLQAGDHTPNATLQLVDPQKDMWASDLPENERNALTQAWQQIHTDQSLRRPSGQ